MTTASVRDELAPTGVLRASINLGNPVLAQGDSAQPAGVTVDLAAEFARRLGVEVAYVCFDAARHSFEALVHGTADVGFVAIEPARAESLDFTDPYVVIDGVYVVPADSPFTAPDEVDVAGTRVGVKQGSAYDLYLTRTLQHAELVRGAEGVDVLREQQLEAGAGIRQPATRFVENHPQYRVIPERFIQIRQAVAVPRGRSAETLAFLRETVTELKRSGFVAATLRRSGQADAEVAPA